MIAIVACDAKWGIGCDGQLQQRVRADLRRFKMMTWGKVVIYGRNTLDTFPGKKPLPGRLNIILRTRKESSLDNCEYVGSIDELMQRLRLLKLEGYHDDDFIVIGGAIVYRQLLSYCDTIHVTKFAEAYKADCLFPDLDASPDWYIESSGPWLEENGIRFRYMVYRRQAIA
ncbi:MAG TPA: dihydrofolate reductase [Clostridiaceae bacterium]|jgi:dihydrofolate reductase|nr:dihydrofolate reductase [Clostridiaceae bacterium]